MRSTQFSGLFNHPKQEYEPRIRQLAALYADNKVSQVLKDEYLHMLCKYARALITAEAYQDAKSYLLTANELVDQQHDLKFFITGALLQIKEEEVHVNPENGSVKQ